MIVEILASLMFLASPEADADCVPIEKEIVGKSLEGQLAPGQTVHALPIDCAEPRRMDFVIFTDDESQNLVIKQVWGLPGDVFHVDEKGFLFVNGEPALTSFDRPYMVNRFYKKKLMKFEGELQGYLVLGHPGSLDSGRIGPIGKDVMVGVVRRDEGRARD
ncbi:S26 family signal peptidase [Kordiimonas gwangyangensis]|uniref:S26 family signal peptidase n=1 Tax=Kordiimonas gwangyangensis TaxID=288022 RepID=UPI00035D61EE|nr:S26 family signal peptidase [Kordiimonas gwangyangensis]